MTGKDVVDIRGVGLFTAVELKPNSKITAWDTCITLAQKHNILCKPTHSHIIRLTPTLVINEKDCDEIVEAFAKILNK